LLEGVGFHARLCTRGRVCIPKFVVESYGLWVGTRIRVHAHLIERASKYISFGAMVRRGFIFTIPEQELAVLKGSPRDLLEVRITKEEIKKTEAASSQPLGKVEVLPTGGTFCKSFG